MSPSSPSKSARPLVDQLRARVLNGQWKPAQQITSEHQLAKEFGTCRATITKSLRELEREGLLWSQRGKGRFVVDLARRGRTWVIGLVLADLDRLGHPVVAGVLAGIRNVVGPTDYHLKLVAVNASSDALPAAAQTSLWMGLVDPNGIDGAIIMTRELPREQAEALAAHVPVVWLQHETVPPRITGVWHDFAGGAYDAAHHLAELGHRRIGLITIGEAFAQGRDQRKGVRLGLRELLARDEASLAVCSAHKNAEADGYELGRQLLSGPDRPTAVICGSDDLAIGVYRAAVELKLRVPHDLSMVGWNDHLTLEDIPTPMTSVRIDDVGLGAIGAQRLLNRLDRPGAAELEGEEVDPIPIQLIVRQSTMRLGAVPHRL